MFCASDRDHQRGVAWCEIDAYDRVPLNHTVRTGEPVLGSMDDLAGRFPAFTSRQASTTRSLASLPVVAAGHIQGGLVLFYDTPQRFDRQQLAQLMDLAARLGSDLRRAQRTTVHASRSLQDEPLPVGAVAATYSVAAEYHAVAAARRFMAVTMAEWGIRGDTVDAATLCLSELVTNAIIHTDAGCELRLVLDRGVLTTTVRDSGPSVVVDLSRLTTDPLAVHGRGLQLLDALSTRWGSELDADGMTVWFVLEPGTNKP